jgi:ubiquitin-like domain-containing CTD phosphatase 1
LEGTSYSLSIFPVICIFLFFNLSILNFSTIEEEILVGQEYFPELLDYFEFDQNEVTAIKDKDVYKQKLRQRAIQYKV